MSTIAVPIDSQIVGELFLRKGPAADIRNWIENVLWDYLDRTAEDGEWSEAYHEYREGLLDNESFAAQFGNREGGYHWAPLFLPNGTQIRMQYKRKTFNATVKFDKIDYDGQSYSPSELARAIAVGNKGTGTSRNAWRDLFIKRPSDSEWALADVLRQRALSQ